MDPAEAVLRYVAVPTLSAGLAGLIGLLIWVLRTQGTLQATMAGLKVSVEGLDGRMEHLGHEIVDLTGEIRRERNERNNLTTRVAEHDVWIENLDGRVTVLERGIERRKQEET